MSRQGTSRSGDKPYSYRFPMVSVAADVVCFTVRPEGGLQVALVRRSWEADAFAGYWALPGGFLRADADRSMEDCARRELFEETRVEPAHLELVDVFSTIDRDPRPERVLSIAYLAIVPAHGLALAPIPDTDVTVARWFAYGRALELDLAFDHRLIIEAARRRLADKIGFRSRGDDEPALLFAFLPERFAIARAEQVAADIGGVRPDRANFRKWITRYVAQTAQTEPGRTRHAHLYERRRRADPIATPLSGLLGLAGRYGVADMALFTDSMRSASRAAVAFLEQLLGTYGGHSIFSLKVTRVPDLRINHRQTGRVLLAMTWQVRKQSFACTAVPGPEALKGADLDGLRPWNGPHRSAFRLGRRPDDMIRLAVVLEGALAKLAD